MFYTYLTPDNKHLIDFSMVEDHIEFSIEDYVFICHGNYAITEEANNEHIGIHYNATHILYDLTHNRLSISISFVIDRNTQKIENATIIYNTIKYDVVGIETVLLHYLFLIHTGQIDKRLNYQFPLNYL